MNTNNSVSSSRPMIQMKLNQKNNFRSVDIDSLKHSCGYLIAAIEQVYKSAIDRTKSCSLNGIELFFEKEDWKSHVVASAIWEYMEPTYTYAEGLVKFDDCGSIIGDTDDLVMVMASWCSSTIAAQEMSGYIGISDPILQTLTKFFARLKLDYKAYFDSVNEIKEGEYNFENVFLQTGFFGDIHLEHLTLVELALLAGVKNIRTIRNAQYDKNAPLEFFKENGQVLVTVDVARKWLEKRRGFVKTPEIDW